MALALLGGQPLGLADVVSLPHGQTLSTPGGHRLPSDALCLLSAGFGGLSGGEPGGRSGGRESQP